MIVLADNDIVHKLACCNLLDELLVVLGSPPVEVHVVPTMRFVLRRKLKNDAVGLAAFERFIASVTEVEAPSVEAMARFQDIVDIDGGEQQLVAKLFDDSRVTGMVTGDKRALRAFGKAAKSDLALTARLAMVEVLCLESIMLRLIATSSFEAVNEKVSAALTNTPKSLDVVLQASFGAKRTEQNSKDTLDSYLGSLRQEVDFIAQA